MRRSLLSLWRVHFSLDERNCRFPGHLEIVLAV